MVSVNEPQDPFLFQSLEGTSNEFNYSFAVDEENENSQRSIRILTNGNRRPGLNSHTRISLHTNIVTSRSQLFEVFFRRVAFSYARIFPLPARRIIEFGFLVQAVFVLLIFIHIHITFVRSPVTCLDYLRNDYDNAKQQMHLASSIVWPRDGILRVEIIHSPDPSYSLKDSYAKEFYGADFVYQDDEHVVDGDWAAGHANSHVPLVTDFTSFKDHYYSLVYTSNAKVYLTNLWSYVISLPSVVLGYFSEMLFELTNWMSFVNPLASSIDQSGDEDKSWRQNVLKYFNQHGGCIKFVFLFEYFITEFVNLIGQFVHELSARFYSLSAPVHIEDNYIVEYALEYGFLRLSPQMRKKLNITVKLVVLDPDKDACFGSTFSRFLMREFLGYEDFLLGSIKYLSTEEGTKGYVGNVVSGQHYRLVSSQMSRLSYLPAALIMLLFTFSVSILLRYSSQQLVVVISDMLQVFETTSPFSLPIAPFMTVIFALVAMETIMSEFFGDSITAFYVILIVSVCDHYEAMFCRTLLSRCYWPRFFYIYHFAFYAYHYRFNGQFSGVALWVSWLFILHSMIYFFHHFELPNLLSTWDAHEGRTVVDGSPVAFQSTTNQFPPAHQINANIEIQDNERHLNAAAATRSSSDASPISSLFGDERVGEMDTAIKSALSSSIDDDNDDNDCLPNTNGNGQCPGFVNGSCSSSVCYRRTLDRAPVVATEGGM